RIDRGIDTGPVYGYFRVDADPIAESHVVIQHRAVLDHLDAIRETLLEIARGRATEIDTSGRRSATWGQPWLSAYVRMRRNARRRVRLPAFATPRRGSPERELRGRQTDPPGVRVEDSA